MSVKPNFSSKKAYNNKDYWGLWNHFRKKINQTFKPLKHWVQDYKEIEGNTSGFHSCSVRAFPRFGSKETCPIMCLRPKAVRGNCENVGLGNCSHKECSAQPDNACVIVSWKKYKKIMFQVKVMNNRASINILKPWKLGRGL